MRCALAMFVFGLLAVCAGCGESTGPTRVPMSGKVTLNGIPIASGSVSLLPEEGNEAPTANATIQQGEYRFDSANGPTAGAYRVLVSYSTAAPVNSKTAAFASKPAKNGEFNSQVDVPSAREFQHDIEIK